MKKAIAEIHRLSEMMENGRLSERGRVKDFSGSSAELIQGVNQLLDAVLDPVKEAGRVLGRVAKFDLSARIKGKYKGDHAQITKNLNLSLQALHDAFVQVTQAAATVSSSGGEIRALNSEMARGALDQTRSLHEISTRLEQIASRAKETVAHIEQATQITQDAQEFVETGKAAMVQLMGAMKDVRASAEETLSTIQEIHNITAKTEELAAHAAVEAGKVGASARGFSVVAEEVRKLAMLSKEVAKRIADMKKQGLENSGNAESTDNLALAEGLANIIREIDQISLKTNYLALNAAVEAAHVSESGRGFELVSEEVRSLANRSKESVLKTETLLQRSVELAKRGEEVSEEANQILLKIGESVSSVAIHIGEIAAAGLEQAQGVEFVKEKVASLNRLTQDNADHAGKSSKAATELAQQTEQLETSVKRFHLDEDSGSSPALS
jgi:methyl-accepting chemotaxis protein